MKDVDKIVKTARRQGWTVEKSRNNHLRFVNPEGEQYFTSSTPSDWRGIRNLVSDLKRRGLVYDRNGDQQRRRASRSDRAPARRDDRDAA